MEAEPLMELLPELDIFIATRYVLAGMCRVLLFEIG